MRVLQIRIWLCAALLLSGQLPSRAQIFLATQLPATNLPASPTLNIAWNPSPGTDVAGYYVYWGTASGACTNRLNVGNSTTATLGGFDTNVNYFFTTVSYNAVGQESPASNEIQYSPQSPLTTAAVPNLSIDIQGSGGTNAFLRLSFQGRAAAIYQLQNSADLRNWATIWTTNCQVDDTIVFYATNWVNYPCQFFRLMKQ